MRIIIHRLLEVWSDAARAAAAAGRGARKMGKSSFQKKLATRKAFKKAGGKTDLAKTNDPSRIKAEALSMHLGTEVSKHRNVNSRRNLRRQIRWARYP